MYPSPVEAVGLKTLRDMVRWYHVTDAVWDAFVLQVVKVESSDVKEGMDLSAEEPYKTQLKNEGSVAMMATTLASPALPSPRPRSTTWRGSRPAKNQGAPVRPPRPRREGQQGSHSRNYLRGEGGGDGRGGPGEALARLRRDFFAKTSLKPQASRKEEASPQGCHRCPRQARERWSASVALC